MMRQPEVHDMPGRPSTAQPVRAGLIALLLGGCAASAPHVAGPFDLAPAEVSATPMTPSGTLRNGGISNSNPALTDVVPDAGTGAPSAGAMRPGNASLSTGTSGMGGSGD